jgi:GNAT superfamily N-acetyltransferase
MFVLPINKTIQVPAKPSIKGLHFRRFEGQSDYPKMVAVIEACKIIDRDESSLKAEDLKNQYAHLVNCDPYQDMLFAEMDDKVIAYARVTWWEEEAPKQRIYFHFFHLMPEWRGKEIEESILRWSEKRLEQVAASHPKNGDRLLQSECTEFQPDKIALLTAHSYKPTRYFTLMSRPLDDIPVATLPEGIDVHPVTPDQHERVWQASTEAFRDHWGFAEPKEEEFTEWRNSRWFQPHLWQVAWDGDEIVGQVQNYIDSEENQEYQRQRGWTEGISVRRPWRGKGVAKALIVRSMHMHKALGMSEVALGVDTNNPNGALQLYEGLGYKAYKKMIVYRKPFAK